MPMEDLENASPEHHAVISDWICSFHRWMLSNDRKENTARAYTRSMVFLFEEDQKSPAAMASQEYFELTKASLKNKIGNGQRSASVRLWKMFFEELGSPETPPEKSDGSKLFQVNIEAGEARKTSTPQNKILADENSAEVKQLRKELELPPDWSVGKRSRNSGDLLTAMSPGGRIYTSKQAVDVRLGREPSRPRLSNFNTGNKDSSGSKAKEEPSGEPANDADHVGEKRKKEKGAGAEAAAPKRKAAKREEKDTDKDKEKEKKAKSDKKEKKEKKEKKDKKDKKDKKQKKKEKKEQKKEKNAAKASAKAAAAAAATTASSSSSSSDKEEEEKKEEEQEQDSEAKLREQVEEAARGNSTRRVVPLQEAWGTAVACANVLAGRAYDERQLDAFLLRGRAPDKTLAARLNGLYVQQESEICGMPYFRKADNEKETFVMYHGDKRLWRITGSLSAKGEFGKVKDKNDVPWKAKKTWKIFDGTGAHIDDEDIRLIYMDAEALPVGEQVEICLPVLPEACLGAVTTKRQAPPPSSNSSSSDSADE